MDYERYLKFLLRLQHLLERGDVAEAHESLSIEVKVVRLFMQTHE